MLADEVRRTLALLEEKAPGGTVEVRVPPYGAVQCIAGMHHRRDTPPNVVETTPEIWLKLADGSLKLAEAEEQGLVDASGVHAMEVENYLPVI